jgi:hypothetical protein
MFHKPWGKNHHAACNSDYQVDFVEDHEPDWHIHPCIELDITAITIVAMGLLRPVNVRSLRT